MTVVELLRNAGAEPREDWGPFDDRRPLDDGGREEAAALVDELLEGPPIHAVVASPALRCRQTLEPLAREVGVPIRSEGRLAESEVPVSDEGEAWVAAAWTGGRALRLIDELVESSPDARVVCCSHGEVIPATVALLAGRDGLPIAEVRCAPAGRFTLTFDRGRCIDATAVPPPRVPRTRRRR